jgi:hypothetical protein
VNLPACITLGKRRYKATRGTVPAGMLAGLIYQGIWIADGDGRGSDMKNQHGFDAKIAHLDGDEPVSVYRN